MLALGIKPGEVRGGEDDAERDVLRHEEGATTSAGYDPLLVSVSGCQRLTLTVKR